MSQSVVTMLKNGQQYMKTWPVRKELYAPVAMVSCALLFQNLGADYLPQTIAIGAFFLSLPMQGLLWLGHRSDQYLPPQLKSWYQEIHAKMRAQGVNIASAKAKPKYKELAQLLKTAFDDLDSVFTKHWFN